MKTEFTILIDQATLRNQLRLDKIKETACIVGAIGCLITLIFLLGSN